ncbi:hypothetical protein [Thalassobellus citreus]|uniref:hypothetical protein n=1 Tax=Thalassobellus citreus TaxID=3367752 RepID=UPI0037B397AC
MKKVENKQVNSFVILVITQGLRENFGYVVKINELGFEIFILISTFAALLEEDFKIYI